MRDISIFPNFDRKSEPIGRLQLNENYAKRLEALIWKGRDIVEGWRLSFTIKQNETVTGATIISAHDAGVYPPAVPEKQTNILRRPKICGGTITFPATDQDTLEKLADVVFPVSSFEITFNSKEKAMESLVHEVFEKIVDSVSWILFGDELGEIHKNLVRNVLINDGIPTELERLADDTEIRAGQKT